MKSRLFTFRLFSFLLSKLTLSLIPRHSLDTPLESCFYQKNYESTDHSINQLKKIHFLHISCICISWNLFRLSVSQKTGVRFGVRVIFSPSTLCSRNKALSYRGKRVGAWVWQLPFSTIVENTYIFDSTRRAPVQLHSLVFETWYASSDVYLSISLYIYGLLKSTLHWRYEISLLAADRFPLTGSDAMSSQCRPGGSDIGQNSHSSAMTWCCIFSIRSLCGRCLQLCYLILARSDCWVIEGTWSINSFQPGCGDRSCVFCRIAVWSISFRTDNSNSVGTFQIVSVHPGPCSPTLKQATATSTSILFRNLDIR